MLLSRSCASWRSCGVDATGTPPARADAPGWPSWSLGNHDVARFATRLARSGDPREVRVLMAALLCLRGTIFLYQGEELGLPQAKVPFERLRDPFDIAAFGGEAGRDGARTPMPWTAEAPNAGFSSAPDTWLPVDPAHPPLSVAMQERDPDSMLNFTRRLIALRRASPALARGEAKVLVASDSVLAIERTLGDERLVCVFELAGREGVFQAGTGEILAAFAGAETLADGVLSVPAFGGAILRERGH